MTEQTLNVFILFTVSLLIKWMRASCSPLTSAWVPPPPSPRGAAARARGAAAHKRDFASHVSCGERIQISRQNFSLEYLNNDGSESHRVSWRCRVLGRARGCSHHAARI